MIHFGPDIEAILRRLPARSLHSKQPRLFSFRAAKVFEFPLAIPSGILAVMSVGRIVNGRK